MCVWAHARGCALFVDRAVMSVESRVIQNRSCVHVPRTSTRTSPPESCPRACRVAAEMGWSVIGEHELGRDAMQWSGMGWDGVG